jgi:hypothetical protein
MLIFLWAYVMMSVAFPGGAHLATRHAEFVQAHMRQSIPAARTPEARIPPASLPRPGLAVGAARAFVR